MFCLRDIFFSDFFFFFLLLAHPTLNNFWNPSPPVKPHKACYPIYSCRKLLYNVCYKRKYHITYAHVDMHSVCFYIQYFRWLPHFGQTSQEICILSDAPLLDSNSSLRHASAILHQLKVFFTSHKISILVTYVKKFNDDQSIVHSETFPALGHNPPATEGQNKTSPYKMVMLAFIVQQQFMFSIYYR